MKRYLLLLLYLFLFVEDHEARINGMLKLDERKDESIASTFTDFDLAETSIFYDLRSRSSFRVTSIENSLINPHESSDQSFTKSRKILRRIGYRTNGCSCQELTCGCCLGINMDQFNFNREGCMNFTYLPDQFAIQMNMIMNNESVYENSVSAKNPPPLCIPLTIPGTPIQLPIDFCAKLYDIYTQDQNLHMCFDLETRFAQAQILVLQFDCMFMGTQGVAPLKPGQEIPTTSTTTTTTEPDIFDPVTEIKYKQISKTFKVKSLL